MPYDVNGEWLGDDGVGGKAFERTTQRRQNYATNAKWLVDPIFPAGAMHLIGGPSGSNKTTWLLQQLHDWDQGLPLFGKYKSNPVPWVYITCDRSLRDTTQTLQRLGYHKWEIVAYTLEEMLPQVKDSNGILTVKESPDINKHILAKFPEVELFVIEGLQAIMPDMTKGRSQNKTELLWALSLRLTLEPLNKTIIATTHNPKVAAAGGVALDARSKFLGSQGFIGTCSTMVGIERPSDVSRENERLVKIMGRNFRDINQTYSLDNDGKLHLESEGKEVVESETDRAIQIISYASAMHQFTVAEMHSKLGSGVSEKTVRRDLAQLVEQQVLQVVDQSQNGRKRQIFLYGEKVQ